MGCIYISVKKRDFVKQTTLIMEDVYEVSVGDYDLMKRMFIPSLQYLRMRLLNQFILDLMPDIDAMLKIPMWLH